MRIIRRGAVSTLLPSHDPVLELNLFIQPDVIRAYVLVTQVEGYVNMAETIVNQLRADVFAVVCAAADIEQYSEADARDLEVVVRLGKLIHAVAERVW